MENLVRTVLFISFLLVSCSSAQMSDIRVISLNIRYDNPDDAPNDWSSRKELVVSYLDQEEPGIFGLQEALWHQYKYIDSCLPAYSSVAAGRNDGYMSGEMTPVFFRNDMFASVESGTFWLSETPEIPGSKGWGAVLPRIVTWLELEEKNSRRRFLFFNTHFSHMSDSARIMSSRIILDKVKEIAGDKPFIITGDFNMLPESDAYTILTENGREDALLKDAYLISGNYDEGPASTFNGFRDDLSSSRIDYIFVSNGTEVSEYSVSSVFREGIYISDHWPVEAKVLLEFGQGAE